MRHGNILQSAVTTSWNLGKDVDDADIVLGVDADGLWKPMVEENLEERQRCVW